MTDPDLTPEQEAVRRLLADARHEGATPPEVVARLDDELASLVARRAAEREDGRGTERPPTTASDGPTAAVVDLGARRRRMAGMGLLAAAAVVVAGVGLGQVLTPGSSDSDQATSADSSAGGAEDRSGADRGGADAGGESGSSQLAPESQKTVSPFAATPTVSAGDPSLEDELLAARPTTGSASGSASGDTGSPAPSAGCDLPRLGKGRRVGAEVDGQPGLIVFRRPDGALQQVELYVCGTTEPVRTLTLPAP